MDELKLYIHGRLVEATSNEISTTSVRRRVGKIEKREKLVMVVPGTTMT